jgi:hypothetical protein
MVKSVQNRLIFSFTANDSSVGLRPSYSHSKLSLRLLSKLIRHIYDTRLNRISWLSRDSQTSCSKPDQYIVIISEKSIKTRNIYYHTKLSTWLSVITLSISYVIVLFLPAWIECWILALATIIPPSTNRISKTIII